MTEATNLWSELATAERAVEKVVLAALPWRVRAAGFPAATSIVCDKSDYDVVGHPSLAVVQVHDPQGLLADKHEDHTRIPAIQAAFQALGTGAFDLDMLGEVSPLGDDDYYSYDGRLTFRFDDEGAVLVLADDVGVTPEEAQGSLAPDARPPDLEELCDQVSTAWVELQQARQRAAADIVRKLSVAIRARFPTATSVRCSMFAGDYPLELRVAEILEDGTPLATADEWSSIDEDATELGRLDDLLYLSERFRGDEEIQLDQPPGGFSTG